VELDQITAWISEKRFAPFLERGDGDEPLAVKIYLWHAEVAGASLVTLHHFEVALRNAIDRKLGADDPEAPLEETWLLDPTCGEWLMAHTRLAILLKQRPVAK
jgi:hypothetical protein